jgi:hypothetical protein
LSDIRANTISDAAGTGPINLHKQSAAKAWCNYSSHTPTSLRDSLNVSSVTDSGVGLTDVNFSNAFANAVYAGAGATSTFHVIIENTSSSKARSSGFFVSGVGGQRAFYDTVVGNIYHGDLA